MLHVRVHAVVLGGELAFLHQLDRAVGRGLEVPQRRGHHRVGVLGLRVDHVADGELALFLGRVRHAEALGVHDVGALVDHREGRFLGLRRVEPAVDEAHAELHLRVRFLRARHERVHEPVHLGNREAADHADAVALGHAARDHAAEVGRFLDVVVEHREVGRLRLQRRAHEERHLGEVFRDLARRRFHPEHLAQDQLVAARGVLAHHALVVGIAHVLGRLVFDLPTCLGRLQRLVDAAHPLLLERHRVHGSHLELGLRERKARGARRKRCGNGDGTNDQLTACCHGLLLD
ncbi:hypothetical protein D3C72_1452350 [compost metagenome]